MNARNITRSGVVVALIALFSACGGGGESEQQATTEAGKAAALDQGPRAGAVMELDEDLAVRGEALFDAKACADCHAFGEADIAPDLRGVTDRRTREWLVMQITDPEWMTAHDPITQKLVAEFDLEMVDLGVSAAEVEPILHYLLRENRSTGTE